MSIAPGKAPIRYWQPARERAAQLVDDVVFDGYDFAVKFHYYEGIGEAVKAQCRNAEKRWHTFYFTTKDHRFYRYWRINKAVIEQNARPLYDALHAAAKGRSAESFEAFLDKFEDARANPQPSAFVDELKETIYPLKQGGAALLGTYHPGVVAVARSMGASYLSAMRAWKLRATSPLALKNYLMAELALRDDQVEVLDVEYDIVGDTLKPATSDEASIHTFANRVPDEAAAAEEAGEQEVYLAVTSPLKRSEWTAAAIEAALARYSLYDYQQAGFRHLASHTSVLLADEMGLGKSRQAVAAAHFLAQGRKVLIACPSSLIINWTREIRMVVPQARIGEQAFDAEAQWIVTNYERLEALLAHAHEFRVMVTDEAHLLKEATAKRTRLAFDIASKVPYRFILTGTPILNTESEIHTLLRLSGHPVGDMPLGQFKEAFAGNPAFRLELNKRIREWMLRRRKDVVLASLRGKQQQVLYIDVHADQRAQYDAVAADSSLLALAKIQRLRTLLERIKLEAVLEMIAALQAQDKVLVFCEFTESVSSLKARLAAMDIAAVTITGEDSNRRRQDAVDQFQQDPEVRVFIGTTLAAGVGINLTAANYVIFASLPWTPALKEQAEDRAYRNGQQRLVIVKIPLLDRSIDNDLWEMLRHKKSIATDILNPDESEQQAMHAFAGSHIAAVAQSACAQT